MSDEKIPSTLAEYRDEYIPAYDAGWRAACLECAEIAEREAEALEATAKTCIGFFDESDPGWDAIRGRIDGLRAIASRYRQMAEGGDKQEERRA